MKGPGSQVFAKNIEQLWPVTLALSKDIFFQFFDQAFAVGKISSSVILKLLWDYHSLGFVHVCPARQTTVLPSAEHLPLWSVRASLAEQAEPAPLPAKLNPPCLSTQTAVMFPFDPVVTVESQMVFCRAILVLFMHYVLLIWDRWRLVSVPVTVY